MQSSSLRMRNEQKDFPIAHVLLERICADFLSGNVLCQGKVNSPVADAQECDSFWYLHILDCRRFVHELCILVMNILKVECNFACSAGCSRLEEPKCTASTDAFARWIHVEKRRCKEELQMSALAGFSSRRWHGTVTFHRYWGLTWRKLLGPWWL